MDLITLDRLKDALTHRTRACRQSCQMVRALAPQRLPEGDRIAPRPARRRPQLHQMWKQRWLSEQSRYVL